MKQRGRKSKAALVLVPPLTGDRQRPEPPASLDAAAATLWRRIVSAYEPDHFNPADLVLLRELCFTSATLLPMMNSAIESGDMKAYSRRSLLTKELVLLSTKLRLAVSSRTRGDLASTRNAGKRPGRGVEELARLLRDEQGQ